MYVKRRIGELGRAFTLRVLLVLVDTDDNIRSLLELNSFCFLNDFTLILAWSREEAARYIETLKAYEKKSPESIQEKVEKEFGKKFIPL